VTKHNAKILSVHSNFRELVTIDGIDIVLYKFEEKQYKVEILRRNNIGFIYSQFDMDNTNTPSTSHSVDLPINTIYSCQNKCGPQSQCSITREQCTSDIDCYGCQPQSQNNPNYLNKHIYGYNGAGKLVYNQNPQYSTLTTDIASNAYVINNKAKVPLPYTGLDLWTQSANYGNKLYQKKLSYQYNLYTDSDAEFMPKYPQKETATGIFLDAGPPPANSYHL